jgi:hypothetical protein
VFPEAPFQFDGTDYSGEAPQSFFPIPCNKSDIYCAFGSGDKNTYFMSVANRWAVVNTTSTGGFTELSPDPSTRRSIGSLKATAWPDVNRFVGTGQKEVRVQDGELSVHLLNGSMVYEGLPCLAFKHRIGSGSTVRLREGTLLQTVNYKCKNDSIDEASRPLSAGHSTLGLYSSVDGLNWLYKSTVVSWHQTIGPDGHTEDEGPNENSMVILPVKSANSSPDSANSSPAIYYQQQHGSQQSLLVVVRADSGDGTAGEGRRLLQAYFTVRSDDSGSTWMKPERMTATNGVPVGSARPKLLLLRGKQASGKQASGPLILSGGRPGLFLWVNAAADGKVWEAVNVAEAHNNALGNSSAVSSLRFCEAFVMDNLLVQHTRTGLCTLSMAYTSIVPTSGCSGIVLYDRKAFTSSSHKECDVANGNSFSLPFEWRGAGCE